MDTLRAAARLSGGPEKLARFLGVPQRALARWLKGEEKPPARVFAACSDLVLFHERHLS